MIRQPDGRGLPDTSAASPSPATAGAPSCLSACPDAAARLPPPAAATSSAGGQALAQATLDALPTHVAVLDAEGGILMRNRAWNDFADANAGAALDGAARTASDGLGDNYLAVCDAAAPDPYAERAAAGLRAVICGAQPTCSLEYPCHSPTVERWFRMRVSRLEASGDVRVVVCHDDVTGDRLTSEHVVTQAALLDEVDVAVIATDLAGRITQWNSGAERLHGWTIDEVQGRDAADLLSSPVAADPDAGPTHPLFGEGRFEREVSARRRDGSTFRAFIHGGPTLDASGQPAGRVGVVADISERVEAERVLAATRDHLRAVTDSMGDGLLTLDAEGCVTYMNGAAERLLGWSLQELAGRPAHGILHDPASAGQGPVDRPIERAQQAGAVVRVRDDVFLRCDGVALPVAFTASPLETAAGVQGCVVVFADITERKAREETLVADAETLTWIGRISDALKDDRLVLHAQPIVDLRTGAVVQRELLVRMIGPDGGLIGPGAFLPTAEEYGLISDIDRWVVREGLRLAAADGAPVQVNLSARSVGDQVVLHHIEQTLLQTGVDPGLVVFEITETALVQDEAAALHFVERLHDLGCGLALDDFGMGYGGFTYLKRFPINMVKVDIEFVRDAVASEASRHVIQSVVALAASFRLQTVAEGIEDAATLELVRELGVDRGQGYHIARPAPLDGTPGRPTSQPPNDRSRP